MRGYCLGIYEDFFLVVNFSVIKGSFIRKVCVGIMEVFGNELCYF